ncbi:MAG: 2-C-methyl-D-erythritol 4-phosphate cytidylyltransferase [Eubacteriales bacterium]|nr:2-C-methyl-D-erythritol 4-phosphate cytidylyltransferase [Eubacteriales bacterium]MDD4422133.1 2-C-methyl-D-erythritol 4-phosphate cytidylyltransferase [Eubacteriales bacterium]HBR31638.1 2-C-methyl-D-erythritol 4-phosphate cytidylyltransferase [Clostridiales bacterium]
MKISKTTFINDNKLFVSGIIVAAGSGTRMGTVAKPLIKLGKKTVFEFVLAAFAASAVDEIIVVCNDKSAFLPLIPSDINKPVLFAEGGETRALSVYNGVSASNKKNGLVCIHDCARPFVTPEIINNVIKAASESGVATASCTVTDTIKYVNGDTNTVYTPERKYLLSVQTPQALIKNIYTVSFALAKKQGLSLTDETTMAENAGFKVTYVESSKANIKLTTPEDIKTAKAILYLTERGDMTL